MIKEPISQIDRVHFLNQIRLVMREEKSNLRIKDLYNCFYTPPEFSEQKREVEECHQALIKALEKPERRLVLRIMDAQSLMAEKRSIDSFISGFELAWQLSMELNQYEKERSVSRCTAKRSGVLSMSGEEKEP